MGLLDAQVRAAIVDLADTLVPGFDVDAFFGSLVHRFVELLAVDSSGLLLVDERGEFGHLAASTDSARALQLVQRDDHEGPGPDSCRGATLVSCPDLSDAGRRWPRFASTACEAGYLAVHAVPMRGRGRVIGAVNLYECSAGGLDDDAKELGQTLADVAAIGIMHQCALRRQQALAEQLQVALDSRVLIEQAKGMVAERLRVSVAEAFGMLRNRARSTNTRLSALAGDVVDGRFDPSTLRVPP